MRFFHLLAFARLKSIYNLRINLNFRFRRYSVVTEADSFLSNYVGCEHWLLSLSTCGVHEFCREIFKLVLSFSCPSSVLVNIMYCSLKYCCSNSYIPGVILRAGEGRRPWATTISPSGPHISFFLFRQPWATTISPSGPPHLTLPGKTTFLNGIFRAFKVWFLKSSLKIW